jgi:hypothetical protein
MVDRKGEGSSKVRVMLVIAGDVSAAGNTLVVCNTLYPSAIHFITSITSK